MTTIAVFGATGYTGGHILAEAVSRGHRVIAIARDVSGVEPRDGVEARAGSLADSTFVSEVAAASDVLLVAVPTRAIDGFGLADAVPALLQASRDQHVRVGIVGGAGSTLQSDGGPRVLDSAEFPDAFKPEALAAAAVLEDLRASTGADWFVLSPAQGYGSYAPGERTGAYRSSDDVTVTDADGRSFISGEDFAIAIVDEVETPQHRNARFTVGY